MYAWHLWLHDESWRPRHVEPLREALLPRLAHERSELRALAVRVLRGVIDPEDLQRLIQSADRGELRD